MKRFNDHELTFGVGLEPGEEVHAFVSSYRQKHYYYYSSIVFPCSNVTQTCGQFHNHWCRFISEFLMNGNYDNAHKY